MKYLTVMLFGLLLSGCAHDKLVVASNFRSPRLERELNYWVANFSPHETNHFYVGATKLDHGVLVEAQVYWKEERTLMRYLELEPDAPHYIGAWPDQLKLDRDTVDTQEEADDSSYAETHRVWVEWMEECMRQGKPYCVLATDARRAFPPETSADK